MLQEHRRTEFHGYGLQPPRLLQESASMQTSRIDRPTTTAPCPRGISALALPSNLVISPARWRFHLPSSGIERYAFVEDGAVIMHRPNGLPHDA
jgi:hypothetical protein